ncbi:hypothetical protein Q5P01_021827 [Channa striata]|uniref:G-protein coupled receptors family 1 profile domain-containing protein n=1 Tax=Channa striata TaxID=64152 RepID=A0AA88LVR9_CHASR|nr:hypothetical protein Q5P01_021827 [Channa striata]
MAQSYFNSTSTHCNGSNIVYNKEIRHVVTLVIISVGLPLTLVAIYAVYSLVQKNNVAPIYIINLLISDLVQFCCMIIRETGAVWSTVGPVYIFGLTASVGFMVCIALERYLVIAWPLWYRHRRTIRVSLMVCVVVWTLSLVYLLLALFWVGFKSFRYTVLGVFLLLPFPLLVFFLGGTIKALSAAISVPTEEKRRIMGLLVLVLLIYTLLFLPSIIRYLVENTRCLDFANLSFIFLKLSPLADLFIGRSSRRWYRKVVFFKGFTLKNGKAPRLQHLGRQLSTSICLDYQKAEFTVTVATGIIISVSLPLNVAAICSACSQPRIDRVSLIYVINLLLSNIIQLCSMIGILTVQHQWFCGFFWCLYVIGLMASLGFMVCICLDRYLVITSPTCSCLKKANQIYEVVYTKATHSQLIVLQLSKVSLKNG